MILLRLTLFVLSLVHIVIHDILVLNFTMFHELEFRRLQYIRIERNINKKNSLAKRPEIILQQLTRSKRSIDAKGEIWNCLKIFLICLHNCEKPLNLICENIKLSLFRKNAFSGKIIIFSIVIIFHFFLRIFYCNLRFYIFNFDIFSMFHT